jgi:hypothetical protein
MDVVPPPMVIVFADANDVPARNRSVAAAAIFVNRSLGGHHWLCRSYCLIIVPTLLGRWKLMGIVHNRSAALRITLDSLRMLYPASPSGFALIDVGEMVGDAGIEPATS